MRINAQFCFLFTQIKHISTKKNFEMYLRAGKTKICSVFLRRNNGKIQSMLWFYVCFNVEIRVIWVKNKLFPTIYVRFL